VVIKIQAKQKREGKIEQWQTLVPSRKECTLNYIIHFSLISIKDFTLETYSNHVPVVMVALSLNVSACRSFLHISRFGDAVSFVISATIPKVMKDATTESTKGLPDLVEIKIKKNKLDQNYLDLIPSTRARTSFR